MSSLYVILLVVIAVTLMGVSIFRSFLVKTKADYLVAGLAAGHRARLHATQLVDRRRLALRRR